MSTLDWIVLGLFVLALAGIVVWVIRKKDKDTADYFLAGRDATWIAIGASIFASNIGSEHLVGLAGAGAESGMAMAHWEMHGWMILLLGWLFVPFYSRSKIFTMPEFLERRYNPQARSFLSVISLVSYVLTKVAVTVYAGGVVFKDVFNIDYINFFGYNIDFFWISAIGLVVLTGLYTTFGGMKAVLYTSVLQTPILLFGSIAILVLGLIKVGGWHEMMQICSANITVHGDSMTSLIRSAKDSDFPWTGVILGSAIIGFWYWCTDQFIVQRVLSGRDMKQARRGAIFGAYLKLTPVFIFLIPGMIAYALNQKGLIHLQSNDAAFSTMVKELLPIGFKGVVIGGILAALMSSLASLFNSSAMLFTVDFYQKYKPDKSERHYVIVGRIATIVIVLLGIAWIPVMKGLGKVLYEYLQDVQSLLAPGIAAVFLLGILSKRTTPSAGIWGLVIGFTLGMTRLILKIFSGSVGDDSLLYTVFLSHTWLHYEIYLFFIVIISMVIISYFTKKK
ncbi:MAG: sodium:solute symporter, partial [Prolixibacteraceae bacterium]|nr:sodium:solute symporter [Prolixibacteraceae bacterium]